MRALLDVSVLLALLDSAHVHHRVARAWLAENIGEGWASSPMTQNGYVRLASAPAYPNPVPVSRAVALLGAATAQPHHDFWPDDISLLDPSTADARRIHGSRQVTDAYLLALAVSRGGVFATLDRSVGLSAVRGATSDRLVIL